MATFVAKNSGGVKKKSLRRELFFIRFSFNKRPQRLAGVRGFTIEWFSKRTGTSFHNGKARG